MSPAGGGAIPLHLALIPDGNRRWARTRGLEPSEGHRAGIRNVGRIAAAAWAAGVKVVTFWWSSPANLTLRSPEEVAVIVGCLDDWLRGEGRELLAREGAAFEAHGRWQELCPELAPAIEAAPGGGGGRRLVLLMGYDGREEVRAAAEALGGAGEGAEAFRAATWTGHLPPVDLLVRTAGEPHLSAGFMLWHIGEAQLAFPEAPWPAFSPEDLAAALRRYAATERRFGR